MPAYMRTYTSSGVLQFDTSFLQFTLRAKGTAVCSTLQNTGNINYYITTITVASLDYPMLALAAAQPVSFIQTNVSGSTWTFTILSLTSGAVVDWYVFDRSVLPDTTMFFINNEAAEKVFGISERPLRILGAGAGTYPSGRVYATIQTASRWRFFETNPGGSTYRNQSFYGASAVNGNVVTGGENRFEDYSIPGYGSFTPQSYTPPAAPTLVVDVTHY